MSRKAYLAFFFAAALPVVALADHQTRPGQPGYKTTLPRSCVQAVVIQLSSVPGWRQSAVEVGKGLWEGSLDDQIVVHEEWLLAARKAILQYQSKP